MHATHMLQSRAAPVHENSRRTIACSYRNFSNNGNLPYTTAGTEVGESKRLADYLASPFDFATFGPRLVTGVLMSAQEVTQGLQADIERASTLLQGPRPQSEKQEILVKEVEARLAKYLQKGAALEAEVLTAVSDLLPEDVRQNMPAELKDIMLRGTLSTQLPPTPSTYEEAAAVPIATVAKNQTAAEMEDLRGAVVALRLAIADLNANTELAQSAVLQLNVRESRASLAMRLQRLTPAALAMSDVPVDAARREAKILLTEAEALKV